MDFLTPIINFLLTKFMLSPIGVIFVAVLEALYLLNEYSSETGFDTKYIAYIILMLIFLVMYSVIVYRYNRLDKAKSNELGVLFICHTEDLKLYKQEKYKMKEYFEKTSSHISQKVVPIFVNAHKIRKYDFKNQKNMIKLLIKTNCFFAADITFQVDDINDASQYELMIDAGVVHPDFNDDKNKFITQELNFATQKIKNLKFNKEHKLEKIKFTASSLNVSSSYLIGLVFLLNGDHSTSFKILTDLYKDIDKHSFLYDKIKKAYYNACFANGIYYLNEYHDTYNLECLNEAENYFNILNELYPNNYGYCLNMAAIVIIKYNNLKKAKELIEICKKIGTDGVWLYSYAFLAAFEGVGTYTVITRYKKAFSVDYNIVHIINSVEDKLKENPNKTMLHLALGLLYQQIGEVQLMKYNLSLFNEKYKYTSKDKVCKGLVEELLLTSDEKCINCKEICSMCKSIA